ncbi:TDP-N-acetylfucosamine:lipid II N-acetylfucosaminyltransferase [Saccharicrinis sp. FJH2]|uniref:TDP-N-acetylfucosamine:lipid II N-acetylfucosaminyltransferase n=1 Tax=Saccharicrinis sp. FJH65 TaxID=3344659 RepID=UPI0035F280FF
MILHISSDNKFIIYSISQFEEVAPGKNIFLIDVPNDDYKLKFVEKAENVIAATSRSHQYKQIINNIDKYDFVVIHSLNGERVKIINKAPDKTKFAWIPWGADLYDLDKSLNFYLPETKKLIRKEQLRYSIQRIFENSYNIAFYANSKYKQKRKAIGRIEYYLNRKDNLRIVKPYNKDIKQIDYYYYTIENTLGSCLNKKIAAENILLGNSATPTNNHLEAFKSLSELKLEGRKIIVPLSYGDNKYQKQILAKGRSILKQNFHPVLNLMPIDEYNNIVCSCNVVIMNHIRPQAFGNILTSLWLGARVYLNKENTIYSFFKDLGILIFSIDEDLDHSKSTTLSALNEHEVEHNKKILIEVFSYEKAIERTREIIHTIIKSD